MDWYVMRLPATGGVGVVPESSLEHHRARGWVRCSEAIAERDKDQLRLDEYCDDLDAQPEPEPEPAAKSTARRSKEK